MKTDRLAASAIKGAVLGTVAILVLLCVDACASNASLDLKQFVHTAWTGREGLKGSTRAIAQTPDGYLWLGMEFGLVRFDGVRFVAWLPPEGQSLPKGSILTLSAARDGTLWIGTLGGLASLSSMGLTSYPEFAGVPIFALLEDHAGTVWVGSRGKLCAIRNGKSECQRLDGNLSAGGNSLSGNLGGGVYSLYEDREHHLWAGTEAGVWRWNPGPPERYLAQRISLLEALIEGDRAAGLTVLSANPPQSTLWQIVGDRAGQYALPELQPKFQPYRLLRDLDGALWLGSADQGLLRLDQGKATKFAESDGLSSNIIMTLFEDREGTIWTGTANGLDRFRKPAVSTISVNEGPFSSMPATSILAARDGSIWIGTADGVERRTPEQLMLYRQVPAAGTARLGASHIHEVIDSGLPGNEIGSLFEDPRGRIWVTGREGSAWFENGKFTRVKGVAVGEAIAVVPDNQQGVWIGYPRDGLFHVSEGRIIESVTWPWLKSDHDPRLSAIVPDAVGGGLWLGFLDGGIAYFKDGQLERSVTSHDGLGADLVWNLHIDHEGTVWAATQGGLSRVRDGRVTTLTTKNGLPCDAVHWVIEDNAFSLWLYTACGLLRIERKELEAWTSDSKRAIQSTIFDGSDGVRMHALLNGYSPVVSKAADGKIWFAHLDGVSVIDPLHLDLNTIAPPVRIEQITADGKTYPIAHGLTFPPMIRDLTVDYTALSLIAPEKVRFRFRLEGQDNEWREVVNVRRVQYSNLRPGPYQFRVVASNNSGLWNEEGAALDFSIAPAYYQTNWFLALCAVTFVTILYVFHRFRTYQLAREFSIEMEGRVGERLRIARELHDTLLQSFHGLLLRFQTAHSLLPSRPDNAREELGGAIDFAAKAITESRDAVEALRSSTVVTNDLAIAIRSIGEELAANPNSESTPGFRVEVAGQSRHLHPILRDEVYRIAAEALRNAFAHAQAKNIEVQIKYEDKQFSLHVRDDGKGIDSEILQVSAREGHYGLSGMYERAKVAGGKLTIWSESKSGTEIELTIPGITAYPGSSKVNWFMRKFIARRARTTN